MRLTCHISYTHNAVRVTDIVPHADTLAVSQRAFDLAMVEALKVGTEVSYRFVADQDVAGQAWERTHVRL
jgi:hypothetical protein